MGRPTSYNKQQLLDQIVEQFWQNGLLATPVSQLVKVTGVHAASLYSAFGNKQGLMLAALDHYGENGCRRIEQQLNQPAPAYQNIKLMLTSLMDRSLDDHAGKGCFLVNSVMETANANSELADRAKLYLDRVCSALQLLLEQAQQTGELEQSIDCKDAAVFIQSIMFSLRVMARTRGTRKMLQTTIDYGLQAIFNKRD